MSETEPQNESVTLSVQVDREVDVPSFENTTTTSPDGDANE